MAAAIPGQMRYSVKIEERLLDCKDEEGGSRTASFPGYGFKLEQRSRPLSLVLIRVNSRNSWLSS